jgi:hypothetical protein
MMGDVRSRRSAPASLEFEVLLRQPRQDVAVQLWLPLAQGASAA